MSKRARRTDPETSKESAEKVDRSKRVLSDMMTVLFDMRTNGPASNRTAGARNGQGYGSTHKRMSDLKRRGLVYPWKDEWYKPTNRTVIVWKARTVTVRRH